MRRGHPHPNFAAKRRKKFLGGDKKVFGGDRGTSQKGGTGGHTKPMEHPDLIGVEVFVTFLGFIFLEKTSVHGQLERRQKII